jgi:hypothetical protein
VRGVFLVVVALGTPSFGCDEVFRLKSPPLDSALCAYANLAPDDDEDRDGVLNADDLCPTVPSHGPHDEDGDGAPDECDPCPELVSAGADAECDAVGAACDPDEAIAHKQFFYGFETVLGLRLSAEGKIAGDAFHFTQGAQNYGQVRVIQPNAVNGVYELQAMIFGIDASYSDISVFLRDVAANIDYQLKATINNHVVGLEVFQLPGTSLGQMGNLGSVAATANLRLRVSIIDATVLVELLGDARGSLSVTIPNLPAAPDSITWGIGGYRDPAASTATFRIEFPFMRRIAPKL